MTVKSGFIDPSKKDEFKDFPINTREELHAMMKPLNMNMLRRSGGSMAIREDYEKAMAEKKKKEGISIISK